MDRSAKAKRASSLVPEFDGPARTSLAQRRALLQKTDMMTLVTALYGAGAASEDALLEAQAAEKQEKTEAAYSLYGLCPGKKDVTRAQEDLLRQSESMEPSSP